MGGKEYSKLAVSTELANGEPLTTKGLRDFPEPSLEADIGLRGGDGTDDLAFVVFHHWKAIGHRALAGSITACRHIEVQCLMRPVEIVDGSPLVERPLDISKVPVALEGEDLGLQAAVEPFVLAPALWMIGPAVDRPDAKLEKPHRKLGPGVFKSEAPGATIVDEHRIRQSVTVERRLEMSAYRRASFVVTSCQAQGKARVVVQRRQRVTGQAVLQRTVPLEVHLPKLIGHILLEACVGLSRRARRLRHPIVTAQNLVHGRYRRNGLPVALETMRELARSPGWVSIAQRDDLMLGRSCGALRTVMRPPRPVRQRCIARIVPLDPLVTGLRADAELPAQLPPVHSLLLGKHYKLSSLVHDRHLSPRHRSLPCLTNRADFDVSTMSPNTCQSCLRAKQKAGDPVFQDVYDR